MNWYKAKTILIVFFIITNIFLLANIIYSADKSSAIAPEIIDSTIAVLSNNDIEISKDIIPTKTTDISSAEAVNIISDYDTFAQKFLPSGEKTDTLLSYFDGNQTLSFDGDKFYLDIASPIYTNELSDITKDTAIQKVKDIASKYYGININKIMASCSVLNDIYEVKLIKLINDKPVFDSVLSFSISQNGLHSIHGAWFEESDSSILKSKTSLKSITGVLIDFILHPDRPQGHNVITELRLGYSSYESGIYHKEIMLIPVWQISLSDGSAYYLDAREAQ